MYIYIYIYIYYTFELSVCLCLTIYVCLTNYVSEHQNVDMVKDKKNCVRVFVCLSGAVRKVTKVTFSNQL